jgi:hypothetical protein
MGNKKSDTVTGLKAWRRKYRIGKDGIVGRSTQAFPAYIEEICDTAQSGKSVLGVGFELRTSRIWDRNVKKSPRLSAIGDLNILYDLEKY